MVGTEVRGDDCQLSELRRCAFFEGAFDGAHLRVWIPRPGRPRVWVRRPAPRGWMRRRSRPSRPRAPTVWGEAVLLRFHSGLRSGAGGLVSEGRGGSGVLGRERHRRAVGRRSRREGSHAPDMLVSYPIRPCESHARRRVAEGTSQFYEFIMSPRRRVLGVKADRPRHSDRHPSRQLTLIMQKKLLMLSALMVALACAHAGETPEVTNKVRHAPTHAPASSSSSDN